MQTFPLLLEPEDLALHFERGQIDEQHIRFVDLSRESVYQQIHLPQAVHLPAKRLLRQVDETTGLLPLADDLQALIADLAISPQHWVIAYDDEGGGWASRLIWTLHCLGFERVSLLNGGVHACLAAQLPVTSDLPVLAPVSELLPIHLTEQYRIQYDELLTKVEQGNVQLWDCRSKEEFIGEKRMARRAGHMPGAVHYDWLNLFDKQQHYRLYPLAHIRQQLETLGLDLNQALVVYCQSHHRSSLAYVVARLLGVDVRAYDGAWSEWGNQSNSLIELGT